MTGLDVVLAVAGVLVVLWVLMGVVRTVVIPRPERVLLTTVVLWLVRTLGAIPLRLARSDERRASVLGTFGPLTLVSLPLAWSAGVVAGFAMIFAAMGVDPWTEALTLSSSSLTTLGFVAAETTAIRLVASVEALIGLGIVALMISFLPTIYSAFSRREAAIGHLTVRAGDPPHPVLFLRRAHAIGAIDTAQRVDALDDRWASWEDWFVDIAETHTTFPALVYFRSARADRSWLRAAEAALDTAALLHAIGVRSPGAGQETMLRAGYLALRQIAGFAGIDHDVDPAPTDPISVTRADFDDMIDRLEEAGLNPPIARDEAWPHFAGWRVNYDGVVTELAKLIDAPPSHWDNEHRWNPR